MTLTLAGIAQLVGGELLSGDPQRSVAGVAGLEDARPEHLSFFGNARYRAQLDATQAGAVLVAKDGPVTHARAAVIRVAQPHLAFAHVARAFHRPPNVRPGIAPQAVVDETAQVDPSAQLGPFVWVGPRAKVGARVVLHPGVTLGADAQIGDDSVLHPNVTVYERCIVGRRCVLHAGAVVGADGFGFAFDPQAVEHVKIPQVGIARLEDDVELGANSCVDRATTGETVVGRGAKIDNLVQVGHNSVVGPLSILCAQVGLAGSTTLEPGVMLGGQAGISGHLTIGARTKVAAQSGVISDVAANTEVLGTPALRKSEQWRIVAAQRHLPKLLSEVRALQKRLSELEGKAKP